MNTCHTSFSYILWAYGDHIMSKWSSRTSDERRRRNDDLSVIMDWRSFLSWQLRAWRFLPESRQIIRPFSRSVARGDSPSESSQYDLKRVRLLRLDILLNCHSSVSSGNIKYRSTYPLNYPLYPHLHTLPPFSPSLISLMVSVDVKHHVYLLTYP